jgi:autotransporter translocation and assembly factor TamB
MRNVTALTLLIICFCGCIDSSKRIRGNGETVIDKRNISSAVSIKTSGSFDVDVIPGATTFLQINGESNLIPYIETINNGTTLVLRVKEGYSISPTQKIAISITTPTLEQVTIAGSGNVTGRGKFTGANMLEAEIAGSGTIKLEVNTPDIRAKVAGSGDINLSGETKTLSVKIAGSGNYQGEHLKSESAKVDIAGSGDVRIHAEKTLDIRIAGHGDVYYTGNAVLTQKIAGSGNIKKTN